MTKPKLPHEKKKPGPSPRYGKTIVMRVPVILKKEIKQFIKEKMKEKVWL